ncbi:Adaptor for signal transduction [Ceratobasidium sp. 423]|nr:Adaptor for signal transduction [Ceratobasidium sp. 423]
MLNRFESGFTLTEGAAKPTSNQKSTSINKKMDASEVVSQLVNHGCEDLTGELDLSSFGEHPASHGGLSDIYRGLLLNGTRVAVKALRVSVESLSQDPKHLKRAARELHTWSKCSHPNVMPLLGLAIFRGRIGMIAPWMTHGNLPRYLESTPGVDRLNMIRIIHCDLKGANILVSDAGIPVLTDFGSSSLVDRTLGFTRTTSGPSFTVRWTAAEIFEENALYTEASDVYALGMTIYETMAGKIPYNGKNDTIVFILVTVKKEFPERLQAMPNDGGSTDRLWKLLTMCWSFEPTARPSAAKVAETMRAIVSNTETPILRPTPINHQDDSEHKTEEGHLSMKHTQEAERLEEPEERKSPQLHVTLEELTETSREECIAVTPMPDPQNPSIVDVTSNEDTAQAVGKLEESSSASMTANIANPGVDGGKDSKPLSGDGEQNPFKSSKVTLDDPCWRVIPLVLKKYKINGNWQNYTMFICYGNTERRISYDEKPLLLFQRLKDANKNPVFALRHIKDIHSPIALAQLKEATRFAQRREPPDAVADSNTNPRVDNRVASPNLPAYGKREESSPASMTANVANPGINGGSKPPFKDGEQDPFKSSKLTLDDPCWKVIPVALKKYKVNDDWQNYAMFICYESTERCISYDEKPLLLFRRLKETNKNPVFFLRHIKYIHSPITVAQQKQATQPAQRRESPDAAGTDASATPQPNRREDVVYATTKSYATAVYPYLAESDDEFDVSVQVLHAFLGWWLVQRDPTGTGIRDKTAKPSRVPTGCLLETSIPPAAAVSEATGQRITDYGATDYRPIMPMNLVPLGSPGIALRTYHVKGDEELEVQKDECVRVFKKYNYWSYVIKESNGERGWVPSWYIGKVPGTCPRIPNTSTLANGSGDGHDDISDTAMANDRRVKGKRPPPLDLSAVSATSGRAYPA